MFYTKCCKTVINIYVLRCEGKMTTIDFCPSCLVFLWSCFLLNYLLFFCSAARTQNSTKSCYSIQSSYFRYQPIWHLYSSTTDWQWNMKDISFWKKTTAKRIYCPFQYPFSLWRWMQLWLQRFTSRKTEGKVMTPKIMRSIEKLNL